MSNYLRDLTRVVLLSSDALQADIARIQILQKVRNRDWLFPSSAVRLTSDLSLRLGTRSGN